VERPLAEGPLLEDTLVPLGDLIQHPAEQDISNTLSGMQAKGHGKGKDERTAVIQALARRMQSAWVDKAVTFPDGTEVYIVYDGYMAEGTILRSGYEQYADQYRIGIRLAN